MINHAPRLTGGLSQGYKPKSPEFGHKLLPLPPYSPEYNPIEKTWAHIKKHLKKVLPSCNTFSRLFCPVLVSIDYRIRTDIHS